MDKLLFCAACGAFRPLTATATATTNASATMTTTPDEQQVSCDNCGYRTDLKRMVREMGKHVHNVPIERSPLLHRLYSERGAEGAASGGTGAGAGARLKVKGEGGRTLGAEEEAVIDETCPKCAHPQMSFRTAQLRGVDEGQTIFYTCLNPKCRHNFTVHS